MQEHVTIDNMTAVQFIGCFVKPRHLRSRASTIVEARFPDMTALELRDMVFHKASDFLSLCNIGRRTFEAVTNALLAYYTERMER